MANQDATTVEKINDTLRDLRQSLAERFEDDDPEATLPLLSEPDGGRDRGWWEENVQPLKDALETYKRKLDRDDDSHAGLKAELEVAHDLLPERDER